MPVIGHLEGICHVYLHASADPAMARDIVLNSKMRRTGICGAAETLLVDREAAPVLLPPILDALAEAGCEIRGDDVVRQLSSAVRAAVEQDWHTEYLDAILSVRTVGGVDDAIDPAKARADRSHPLRDRVFVLHIHGQIHGLATLTADLVQDALH